MKLKFLLIITIIGISITSCKNKNSKTNSDKETLINKIEGHQDSPRDTLKKFYPDAREMQYIYDGVFDIPEMYVNKSPSKSTKIQLKASENVIGYDVSPAGLIVASIINSENKNYVKLWKIDEYDFYETVPLPDSITPVLIAWHPNTNAFFIAAKCNDRSLIIRYEKKSVEWSSEEIFSSYQQIKRLILCPRPFLVYYDNELKKYVYSFRLFFGLQKDDGSYKIASITEFGKKFYQVIGPPATFTHSEADEIDPSQLTAEWALPVAFHPSGEVMIWENLKGEFYTAKYITSAWGESSKELNSTARGGEISLTPNGLGILHWQKDIPGIKLLVPGNEKANQLLNDKLFVSSPISTPDGKGLVCLVKKENVQVLEYLLIDYPLSDVVNAWMFAESKSDIDLLSMNYGLFRQINDDQLYQLYESENYYCNDYDQSTPTRPYLVTTDIFWELYGAAFQGIFTVKEREKAIPSFWAFIESGNSYFNENFENSQWTNVFQTLVNLKKNDLGNPEVKNILNSDGEIYSNLLKKKYDYSQLKPLGIYTSTSQMQLYYRAFKYLTTVFEDNKSIVSQLNTLPPDIKEYAFDWIRSYKEFISKPRRQNVFIKEKFIAPKYVQYPDTGLSVFPLSWGFDNEILNSTVFHSTYPKEKQIVSRSGDFRMHPSGLDLAAAITSDFASKLLENDYQEYPNLRPVIQSLRRNFNTNSSSFENTLYDQWINALAQQWIDTLKSTNREQGDQIWQVKRLQTGLASWATLRHATVLVNETGAAECGEAGFEEILMRAPRGYVEPDPYTLESIAKLFEKTIEYLPFQNEPNLDSKILFEGIVNNLKESAEEIRYFKKIAEKEIKGEAITNNEYESIMNVARVAEHKFLIFKSLANMEYSLANPDPMPKITNVFGNAKTSYLMAAVGRPLEWDFIVPFYGRKQVVKGSVYSYYEFVNDNLINDSEWIKQLPDKDLPQWIRPFVSDQNISSPPKCGF